MDTNDTPVETTEPTRIEKIKSFYSRNKEVVNVLAVGAAVQAGFLALNVIAGNRAKGLIDQIPEIEEDEEYDEED